MRVHKLPCVCIYMVEYGMMRTRLCHIYTSIKSAMRSSNLFRAPFCCEYAGFCVISSCGGSFNFEGVNKETYTIYILLFTYCICCKNVRDTHHNTYCRHYIYDCRANIYVRMSRTAAERASIN